MMEEHRNIHEMDADDWRHLSNFTFNLNREQVVARMEKAEAQRDALLAALEAVEWIGTDTILKVAEDGGKYYCPWCTGWAWNHPKHFDHCQRQAAITAVKGE